MNSKKIKIIVVDDEDLICQMLMDFLNDYGIAVEIAASGEEAIKMISENSYDAAIVDMRLPDMVGDDLILKANEIQPGIKYFVHTGSLDYVLTEDRNNPLKEPIDIKSL